MSEAQSIMGGELGKALKTVKMSAASILDGVGVPMDPLHLDEIPHTMEKMGWTVSAKMMRRWFATDPAYAMDARIRGGNDVNGNKINYSQLPASQVDDNIIKMSWLMGFPKIRMAAVDLLSRWNNPAAIRRLKGVLMPSVGWKPGMRRALGNEAWDAKQLDYAAQINSVTVGQYTDDLDDLYGAIFKATLKVAVVGDAYYSEDHRCDVFAVKKLGLYLRDTYDFNDDIIVDRTVGLGVWSRNRILNKAETVDYLLATFLRRSVVYHGFVQLRNTDFSRWQKANGTGGDFFVFSDVLWVNPVERFVRL